MPTRLFFLLALLLSPTLKAQDLFQVRNSCSYDGEEQENEYYTFETSTEADRIVEEICHAHGLEKNFIIRSSNVRNALATVSAGKRVILYSTVFLEKFKADARTRWAAYAVLAHEIGHHLNGHDFDEIDARKRKVMELQADRFSGSALRLLGAGLDDAKAGIELFALTGETRTHPPGSARQEAVASGWKQQDERLKELGIVTKIATPEVENPIDKDLVFVKGGTFIMGCTSEQQDCDDSEKPAHSVNVGDFYIGEYEVTQKLWAEVMGNNPSLNQNCDNCPVEQVSWDDVQEFLQKLNAKYPGKNYRLPTEAEWEYAARGGEKSRRYQYAGSNNIDDVAWYDGNRKLATTFGDMKTTHPVGTKKANELGLYDMSGNVQEWVQDCWHDNYQGVPSDGSAWLEVSISECDIRVCRGGSWNYISRHCRVAERDGYYRDRWSTSLGFRVAQDK